MRFVLDSLYLAGLVLASPWLVWRGFRSGEWPVFRSDAGLASLPPGAIWLHGASVGEVRLIEPLVRLLQAEKRELVISSHTAMGVQAARRAYPGCPVFRFPLDLSFIQHRLIARLKPALLVIVESDLWPNQLLAARRFGVPVAVVNAKLSERSMRLHRWSGFVPRGLRDVRLIAAQTEAHADRFARLGVPQDRIVVSGNMKYDQTADHDVAALRDAIRQRLGIVADDCLIVGGSLHPGEDEDLLRVFVDLRREVPGVRLVIVPRYPDQAAAVIGHAAERGCSAVLKSQLDAEPGQAVGQDQIVVVDTMGELGQFYAAADLTFVGGSLYFRGAGKGGHNLMEPAILGLPVIFGPYNYSFQETVAALLAARGGIEVKDRAGLGAAVTRLVHSPAERADMGQRAREVVLAGQGASERNFRELGKILGSATACSPNAEHSQCRHQPETQAVNE